MKAVFIKRDCLIVVGPSGESTAGTVQLRTGVAESLRTLAEHKLFIVVLDPTPRSKPAQTQPPTDGEWTQRMLSLIRTSGGRVDAVLECPHAAEDHCSCWGTYPGFLYAAAAQLDLRLDECYLFCNEPHDVYLAHKVGCRPMLLLDGRAIEDLYDGHQPEMPGFPIARDLESAVQYLLCEEEANDLWGHACQPAPLSEAEGELERSGEMPEFSPTLNLLTPLPGAKGVRLAGIPQLSRRARQWLLVYVLGGVWLSLGIAYLLTHLYREQRFPAWVWYVTLQFIWRPVRGLLFILSGVILVVVSLRAFLQLVPANGKRK